MKTEIDRVIHIVHSLNEIVQGFETLQSKTVFNVLIGEKTKSEIEADVIHRLKVGLIQILKDLGVDAKTFEDSLPYERPAQDQTANENTKEAPGKTSTPSQGQPSGPPETSTQEYLGIEAQQKRRRGFWKRL